MTNVAGRINEVIEDIFISLEKKERDYSEFKLNNQQYVLLTLIIRKNGITPSELAQQMSITKSAVSQQLAKLEREGYIIRKQHAEDKRTVIIVLGEKGLQYKKEMEKFSKEISKKYYAHLTKEQLHNMLETLQKLKNIIDDIEK